MIKTVELDMVPTFFIFVIQIITGSFLIFNLIVLLVWFVVLFPTFVVAKSIENGGANKCGSLTLKVARCLNLFVSALMYLMFFVNDLRLDKQTINDGIYGETTQS